MQGVLEEQTMQEVIRGLAGVVVADQEHEGAPDGVEDRLDVPANVDQQHTQSNPAVNTDDGQTSTTSFPLSVQWIYRQL